MRALLVAPNTQGSRMGGEPGFVAQKSIRFGLRVLLLFPLNQESVAMSARGSRVCALVSTLSAMVLAIPSVGIKATSRDPFRTRDVASLQVGRRHDVIRLCLRW